MFVQVTTMLYVLQMLGKECKCLKFIDLPSDSDDPNAEDTTESTFATASSTASITFNGDLKTHVLPIVSSTARRMFALRQGFPMGDSGDPDAYLKQKIAALIQQTVHDTTKKVTSIQKLKEDVRGQGPYKAGYILSLVRKSRLMLNDLFNLAVKHRDNWKTLQQLKVFEYIVHTNVDTTNLVRQLVEIHIQHLNSTQSSKRRVVLL